MKWKWLWLLLWIVAKAEAYDLPHYVGDPAQPHRLVPAVLSPHPWQLWSPFRDVVDFGTERLWLPWSARNEALALEARDPAFLYYQHSFGSRSYVTIGGVGLYPSPGGISVRALAASSKVVTDSSGTHLTQIPLDFIDLPPSISPNVEDFEQAKFVADFGPLYRFSVVLLDAYFAPWDSLMFEAADPNQGWQPSPLLLVRVVPTAYVDEAYETHGMSEAPSLPVLTFPFNLLTPVNERTYRWYRGSQVETMPSVWRAPIQVWRERTVTHVPLGGGIPGIRRYVQEVWPIERVCAGEIAEGVIPSLDEEWMGKAAVGAKKK